MEAKFVYTEVEVQKIIKDHFQKSIDFSEKKYKVEVSFYHEGKSGYYVLVTPQEPNGNGTEKHSWGKFWNCVRTFFTFGKTEG